MALKQQHKTDEMATNDTKMDWNCDSDRDKCKYNSKIPTGTWLPPQYVRRRVLKFGLGTYVPPPPKRASIKTLFKELFTNKGEILSCKSVRPCKNRKNHGPITSEQEINPVQIPHPSNATFKFPPPRARGTVKCPGGDVEVSNWSAHKPSIDHVWNF